MRVHVERKPSNFIDMDTPETAAVYDGIMSRNPFFRRIARKVTRHTGLGGKVLDIGCGPGQLLVSLGRLAPDLELHGLDLSSNMLEIAARNLGRQLPGRSVIWHEGSMYEIPLADNTFDLIVNSSVIHMTDTLAPLFNEINRVLKPGGKGYVIGFRRDQPRWVWKIGKAHTAWTRRRRQPLDGMGPVLDSSYTATELENILKQTNVAKFQVTNGRYFVYAQIEKG